jgi:FecR protein
MPASSLTRFTLVLLVAVACMLIALPALADSQARIVRLSDVQGQVQIDKNTGLGFEHAFVNLPITQGVKLSVGNNGRAEIEFEDGSSVRLTPNTTVEVSKLGLSDSGKRMSEMNLVEGMTYVNWLGKDSLKMNFSRESIALDRSAHFRVDTSTESANLAVFKGEVNVEGPAGKTVVEKKKTATFDAADNDKVAMNNKVTEAPLDSWDKEAVSYHDQYAKNNSTPYGYGFSDLNYYGAFSTVPGYGLMWQPYFTGVGWDPFMDGAWGFYPGIGYMYASSYPWGWMPYRYGNWMFVPSFGWMWQPGAWNTWVGVPRYTATTLTHVTALTPPAAGTVKTVVVGRGATAAAMQPSRMTLTAGTAGLGVPRGSLSNLNHLNQEVIKNGSAQVRPAPQFSASASRSSGFSAPQHGSMSSAPMAHTSSSGHAAAPSAPSHR